MNPDHLFVKVFDVSDSGFKDWEFSAFGLIFVAVGLVVFFSPQIVKATGIPYLNVQSAWKTFFRCSLLGFAILWTTITFFATYSEHRRHKALAQENNCRVVEGPVEHFIPMPYSGHADESFSVSGVQFRYSDFGATDAFNNTSSHGGPIDKDSYVRICYDPSGNKILRLEIRDFKGQVKDYSNTTSIFPTPADFRRTANDNPANKLPWYSNLFMVLYILDFVATLNLFLPYLKTFFRLKTTPIVDCAIPYALEDRKKTKLRNSLVFWDRENGAIWLRPRGFNLFQAPLMVAKLNTDRFDKLIIEQEIRFSSGFPFVMALFFWTAYQLFSVAMPANASVPSPGQFVGFGALMFLVVGFVQLRMLRSRMEKMVQDALSELKEMSVSHR